jgi:hypothetical protein
MATRLIALDFARPSLKQTDKKSQRTKHGRQHGASAPRAAGSRRHGRREGSGGGEGDEGVVPRAPQGGAARPPQRLRPQFHPPVSTQHQPSPISDLSPFLSVVIVLSGLPVLDFQRWVGRTS